MFELADENPVRNHPVIDMHSMRPAPHKPFKPYQNLVFTSMIIWKGQRRMVRYYDGCDSIFADEQPKEKDVIEQFSKQTRRREFIDGKFGCYGDERMLLLFLYIASFNVDSEFRTRTASPVYRPVDATKKATAEAKRLDDAEKALELAKNALPAKMMIHADYLGIPLEDYDSGNKLSESEVRTAYRLSALRDPKPFTESYGNKALEIKFYIKKGLQDGLIDTLANPNEAQWKSSGRRICDISGLRSFAAVLERLFEYSQVEDGEEFKVQLTSLFNQ